MTFSVVLLIASCLLAGGAALLPFRRAAFFSILALSIVGWVIAASIVKGSADQVGIRVAAAVISFLGVMLLRRTVESRRAAERLLDAEISARDALATAKALEERSKIARDVHDVLAHSLSAQLIQIRLARSHLSENRVNDAQSVLDRSEMIARESLLEVRDTVGSIRGRIGFGSIRAQVERWSEISGRPVTLRLPSVEPNLSADHWNVIDATIRESLTNVLRHSESEKVIVELRTEDATTLTVTDVGSLPGGRPRPLDWPTSGIGLAGIEGRAREAGGTFWAQHAEDGFQVSVTLPIRVSP